MCEANCSRILFEASSHVPEILAVYFVGSIISQFLSSSLSGVTQQLLIF